MLAFIFRGVFLVAVLSWYSTNVWKMIDSYFKDRFQNYLQAEFKKNPRMLSDINSYAIKNAEKKGINIADGGVPIPAPESRRVEDSLETGTSSVDLLATAASFLESADLMKETGTGENRVKASVDKNAFQESLEPLKMSSARKEKSKSTGNDGSEGFAAVMKEEIKKREKEKKEIEKKEKEEKYISHDRRTTSLKKRRSIIESEKNPERSKKRKFKTITLTDADFKSAKKLEDDDDFSEFDLDEETLKKPREGVLVSELPFKPRADIGELETVTSDEFCPLTLEDETTCGIPSKWP